MNISGLLRRGYGLLSGAKQPLPPVHAERPHEHAVHFYAQDEALLNKLEEYIVEGARRGESCIVIATPEHRQALRDRLATFELEDAFLGLDAKEMLGRFMVGGLPDPGLFEDTIGSLVRTTVSKGKLRAYGKMVALLWAQENIAGTFALEELWNGLQAEVQFPLLCAYPLHDVHESLGDGLAKVCQLHTHVQRLAA